MVNLTGEQHVLVSGAGSGIGRAVALRLAVGGARLCLIGRRTAALRETAAMAERAGASRVIARSADIRDARALARALDAAVREHGEFHGVVANSGIGGANEPGAKDRFEEIVTTNLVGTYNTLRAGVQRLAPNHGEPRYLVVISSILARIGVAGYTGYCASKAGLLGLVRSLALELAPRNIYVNSVCPGWVDTDMAQEGIAGMAASLGISKEEAYVQAMANVPLGRMSQPEDVAGLVAWLLSREARGVTGQALDMNNGAWMG